MVAVALTEAGKALGALDPAVLFSDVDGTLVGRGGSLLADLDGTPTLAAAEALVAAQRAGLEVVLVSGRTRAQLLEAGRLLGLRDAIGELGTVLLRGGEAELQWGQTPRGLAGSPAGSSRTSPGTRAVRGPRCCADRSTRPRWTHAWVPRVSAGPGSRTTAGS